jgi:hypothetical protein
VSGKFCISIDLELAWGVRDHLTDDYVSYCSELERPIVQRLLASLNRYDISATWAIVGNLLSDTALMSLGGKEVWYAPDLIGTPLIGKRLRSLDIGFISYGAVPQSANWFLTPGDCDLDLAWGETPSP